MFCESFPAELQLIYMFYNTNMYRNRYNSTITSMILGREWNQLGYRRKGLRVTVPRGEQRSTYYLSMPLVIPLLWNDDTTIKHRERESDKRKEENRQEES